MPVLLVTFSLSAAAQTASIQGLGALGDVFLTTAAAVSADGAVVVGQSRNALGDDEAYRWTTDTGMVGLGFYSDGRPFSKALGVSADGAVVVGLAARSNRDEAFVWRETTGLVGIGHLVDGSLYSVANGVSSDGVVIVGESQQPETGTSEAFRWTAGVMSRLEDPSGSTTPWTALAVSADGSVVAGLGARAGLYVAFRWTVDAGVTVLEDLPGGSVYGIANGVSADGAVVIGASAGTAGLEAVRWTADGQGTGLGSLPSSDPYSQARAVSADGSVVVGQSRTSDGLPQAFRWTAESGLRAVADLLTEAGADVEGWTLSDATAVSADGTVIVGNGANPQGQYEAWRAVLPVSTVSTPQATQAESVISLTVLPNPVERLVTLRILLRADDPARLSLHDVLGREVAVALDGWRAAGRHETALDVSALPTGVYVVRLAVGARTATQRLTVVR